jgi:hypothetical protein
LELTIDNARVRLTVFLGFLIGMAAGGPALGQDVDNGVINHEGILDEESAEIGFKKRPPAQPPGPLYPSRPFFGDTHLHTSQSFDAMMFGNSLGPDDAYRFASATRSTPAAGCAGRRPAASILARSSSSSTRAGATSRALPRSASRRSVRPRGRRDARKASMGFASSHSRSTARAKATPSASRWFRPVFSDSPIRGAGGGPSFRRARRIVTARTLLSISACHQLFVGTFAGDSLLRVKLDPERP